MKFGYQQPSHTFSQKNVFDSLRQIAMECENQNYDSFWIMDHLVQIEYVGKINEPILEPYTSLAALAAATSKIKLGALCTCNFFRNPAHLSKMGATIDQISNGRFWLGIGAGWFKKEAKMYGYSFPDAKTRLEMLEESLKIIRGAWVRNSFTFRGKHYAVKDLIVEPQPVQKPHPPILVGGGGERITLKLVAKYADACNLFPSGQELERKLDILKKHCKSVGRNYSDILKTKLSSIMFGRNEQEGLRKISEFKPKSLSLKDYASSALLGTPSQIVKKIEELEDIGIEYLIINFRGKYSPSDKRLFSKEVMSSF